MAVQTLYEVHTLKGGNWVVDSTYPDRETAMETARSLYGEKRFEGVKVIRDQYDAASGTGKEIIIYDSSKAPKDRPPLPSQQAAAKAAASAEKKADVDFSATRRAPAKKKQNGDIGVAVKAVLWLVLILAAGGGLIYVLN